MTENEFFEFACRSAKRATSNFGRIGHLICTQKRSLLELTLREPEMRTAFQQEAEHSNVFYGIEVPTRHTYRFTNTANGTTYRRGLIDFALLDSPSATETPDVLVELKEGPPNWAQIIQEDKSALDDYPKITKDIHKMSAEPAKSGRCMLHICQAADSGTINALLKKYDAVTQRAMDSAIATVTRCSGQACDGWFMLVILVVHQRGASKGSFIHRYSWANDHWNKSQTVQL